MVFSHAATMQKATQSAADGGRKAATVLWTSPCSKNWKPLIETKDIGIQACYAVLQLGVGCGLMVELSSHDR